MASLARRQRDAVVQRSRGKTLVITRLLRGRQLAGSDVRGDFRCAIPAERRRAGRSHRRERLQQRAAIDAHGLPVDGHIADRRQPAVLPRRIHLHRAHDQAERAVDPGAAGVVQAMAQEGHRLAVALDGEHLTAQLQPGLR
jgi:hypothetical protein